MTREDILRCDGYWIAAIEGYLHNEISKQVSAQNLSVKEIAKRAEVKKRQVEQALHGDTSLPLETFIKISVACGLVPTVKLKTIDETIKEETNG